MLPHNLFEIIQIMFSFFKYPHFFCQLNEHCLYKLSFEIKKSQIAKKLN